MNRGKKILRTLLILASFGLLGVFFIVLWVLALAPLDRMERIKPLSSQTFYRSGALETGALIDTEQLKYFLKLGELKISAQKWVDRHIEQKDFESLEKGKKLLVNKQVELPRVWENDCRVVYCLQRRMPFNEIPSIFWRGLIGIEDYRFLGHVGIDPKSIIRALVTDLLKMRLEQGGSTITQQLVKNLFYSKEKKFSRKIKEMILSLYLESRYEKENILEAYLNEFEWGSLQGLKIKGLYTASLLYFGKTPQHVGPFEAAILIGLLKGPYYYSPLNHLDRLKRRSHTVFNKLVALNFLSSKVKAWEEEDWGRWQKEFLKRYSDNHLMAFWRAQKNEEVFDEGRFQLYEKYVFIQRALDVLREAKSKVGERDLSVKAFFGSLKSEGFFSFYSKYERNKEEAIVNEFHQVGSTLKPILYSYYFSEGESSQNLVETSPLTLNLKSGEWSPREAHKNLPKKVTLEEALLRSYNRPVIRLAQQMGFEKLEEHLLPLIPRLKTPLSEYPAQLLGAVELSLRELFHIYKKFFFKECNSLHTAEKVVDLMADPSKTTVRRLVGERLGRLSFFGKTGTSNHGYDNWFVSFDGSEIGIIWVGFEGKRKGERFNLYGSNTAFQIFKRFSEVRGKRFNDLICRPEEVVN